MLFTTSVQTKTSRFIGYLLYRNIDHLQKNRGSEIEKWKVRAKPSKTTVTSQLGGTGGREGYGRRERKGREAGVLRGRAAGEKYETLIFLIQQCVGILSKTRTQNIRANYNAGLD